MKESIDSTATKTSAAKGRSPSCPCIGLEEAVSKLKVLYETAKNHEVSIEGVISQIWDSNAQTAKRIAGSLEHYGLAERSNGKIKISNRGFTVLLDERPGERERALADAAIQHPLLEEYFFKWGSDRPQDKICMSELQLEKGFTASGAQEFLKVFDGTKKYAEHHKKNPHSSISLNGNSILALQSASPALDVSNSFDISCQAVHDIAPACNDSELSEKNPLDLIHQISTLLKRLSPEDRSTAIRWMQKGQI